MRRSLTEISNGFGSDKGTLGPTTYWEALNYTDIYAAYFDEIRDAQLTILEIGIGASGPNWDARIVQGINEGGASIKTWQEYFPKADIIGLDINEIDLSHLDRISTFQMDQSKTDDWSDFLKQFKESVFLDIVIDDGSHNPYDQQLSFNMLFPRLKPGGYYFIEDLDNNGFGDELTEERSHSNSVRNTRSVFKEFQRNECLLERSAITDKSIAPQIKSVQFHCPERTEILRPCRRYPFFKIFSKYKLESERLCVIKKIEKDG